MTKKIKVMHVITRLVRGGAQRVVLDLLARLDRERYELVLVSGDQTGDEGSLWNEAEKLGVPLMRLPSLVRQISPLKDLKALSQLKRIIAQERPDVVHAHTSKAGLLACLAAKSKGVRAIVFAPHGHIMNEGAEIPGVPARGWRRRLLSVAARHNVKRADIVVAPNETEREDGIAHGLWKAEECVVIPNGIDTNLYRAQDQTSARNKLNLDTNAPIVGVVARLTREKGVDIALEALAELDKVELVIVGDGPERHALEAQTAERGLDRRVHFFGTRDDVAEILPAFNVVVVPSRTEAHGLIAAEAMACGVPVVASSVGGLKSLVIDGQTGSSVSVNNHSSSHFAKAILRLLDDKTLAESLSRDGRKHIIESFSLETMVSKCEKLYHRLLARK